MSKKYISPEHAIRQLLEFKMPIPKVKPKLPKIEPEIPVKPKPEPEVPTQPKPEPEVPTKPKVEPEAPTQPKTKVDEPTVGKTEAEAETKTKTSEAPDTKPKTSNAPETPPKKTNAPETKTRSSGIRVPSLLGMTPGQPLAVSSGGVFGVRDYLHRPDAPMPYLNAMVHEESADEERRKIENVARPNSDRNKVMARNESIKKKIIDENTKKKAIIKDAINDKYSKSVEISPEIKSDKLTEKFLPRAATAGVAGVGSYETGALEAPRKAFDKYKTPEDQEKALKGQKDFLGASNERYGGIDIATDVASMVPFIGAPAAAYGAKRAFDRGDYTDAALNLVSVVPGVGTAVKGMKFLGKGAMAAGKALQKGGTVASDIATGAQLGDIPYQADKMSKEYQMPKSDVYKDIGNTFYQDVKKDVVDPLTNYIKPKK